MWRQSALDKKVSDRGPGGGSSARDASNQNGTQSKRDFLNAVPPEQRKAVALLLKCRNPRDTKDGKNGKNKRAMTSSRPKVAPCCPTIWTLFASGFGY
jgi:hypothetical protein